MKCLHISSDMHVPHLISRERSASAANTEASERQIVKTDTNSVL